MTPNKPTTLREEFERKLDEELYFLSQDGYAVGWREMKKKDILDIFLSHNTELVRKIEMMKIQYIWDNGACTECGYDTMDEEVIHPCKAYNQAIDEVINLINQEK